MTGAEPLPLGAVTLTSGPFARAQERALRTALELDPDRLLAPFRREAAVPTGPGYGGWEAEGLDGHTLGHVLSALSAHAAGGSASALERLELLLTGLRECQVTLGTGYIGGVPDGVALWREIESGRIEPQTFDLDGRWVPLYNLHKVLTGVVDAAVHADSPLGRTLAEEFVAWWIRVFTPISDADVELILRTESGGLSATLARWAEYAGDEDAATLAGRLAVRELWQPLAAGRDPLDGLHANAQIPIVVGHAVLARIGRGDEFAAAARTFWTSVTTHRTTVIGGNSVREHFPPRDDWSSVFTAREGPETCNTVNMVELARELHRLDGADEQLGFIERALSAHILSAQHPDHGGIVYFTSHRPGHHRVYSRRETGFWCCMGTGLEAPARFAASAFATAPGRFDVALLLGARARWGDVLIETETDRPFGDDAAVHVTAATPQTFALRVRVPEGVDADGVEARVDGAAFRPDSDGWFRIDREWRGRTTIRLALPSVIHAVEAPDGSGWVSLVDGPRVLAERLDGPPVDPLATDARMGHIARGPLLPLADAPVLTPDDARTFRRTDGGNVVLPATATRREIVLEPFASLHDDRYILAFPYAADGDADRRRAALVAEDDRADALDARTADVVAFGQQQPESDHGLTLTGTQSGYDGGSHWRRFHAAASFVLQDWGAAAASLRIAWLADPEARHLLVSVDGVVVTDQLIPPSAEAGVVEIDLAAFADGRARWIVAVAGGDEGSPRLTEARLMRAPLS
ncbi:beta-L-arabinofuranosidase domain-containing protein [Microbacterium oleivorans]|uniref:beta-L-arabinofuranosidase domain-containing protein n=1 Tax=Microbacterium oleivorans TaxID=273677 RepID=UPI00080EA2F8|nr:beta-L-arabinofuranosidase domain-containing protein [Microbacterium oleivorans]